LTIAQLVYDNERHYLSPADIRQKLARLWQVMDECIRTGVSATDETLPGRLQLRRRAPSLYKRLMRGLYPGVAGPAGGMGRPPALEAPKPGLGGIRAEVGEEDGRARLPAMELPLTAKRNAGQMEGDGGVGGEVSRGGAGFGKGIVGNFQHNIMPTPSVCPFLALSDGRRAGAMG
jgi:hypothetical protein